MEKHEIVVRAVWIYLLKNFKDKIGKKVHKFVNIFWYYHMIKFSNFLPAKFHLNPNLV